jgi:hypothetical protein
MNIVFIVMLNLYHRRKTLRLDAVRQNVANRVNFAKWAEHIEASFKKYNITSPSQLVNGDETMIDVSLAPKFTWSRRSVRLVVGDKSKHVTLLPFISGTKLLFTVAMIPGNEDQQAPQSELPDTLVLYTPKG